MAMAATPTAPAFKPHARRIGRGTYQIESRTTPGMTYTTTLTGQHTHTCTCPAGLKNRRCWHADLARRMSDFYARWYGQAGPVAQAPREVRVPAGMAGLMEAVAA